MKLAGEQRLLRVFIGERDRWQGLPLYEAIVNEARDLGLAGATVLKGALGFGCKARIHTAKLLELSHDLPMVVEIVDSEANVKKLLPKLEAMVREGLVTLEKVSVILYRADKAAPRSSKNPGAA